MSRFRVIVSEAIRSLGANLSTTFAATTTVLIGMFMLGGFSGPEGGNIQAARLNANGALDTTFGTGGIATVDLGGRYRLRRFTIGRDLTLRLDVRNVANKRYWIAPPYVGQPRTIAVSASTSF